MRSSIHLSIRSGLLSASLFLMEPNGIHAAETNTPAVTQNAEDQFRLGRAYYRGEGVAQSYEQAGFWYRKAADQGNLKAMNNLGIMFLEGQGTNKDEAEGYRWIRKAAEAGDPRATYLCGVLLCEGKGVKKDPAAGLPWINKAADAGYANALSRLGRDFLYGDDGIAKDPAKALPLIQSAAGKGNPWACGALGEILAKGELLPKDQEKARALFQQGAELGDPASQFEYARILMISNPASAYPWIKLALQEHEIRANGLMLECRPKLTPEQAAAGDAEAETIRKKYQPTAPGK
jgi:TPR repeat protein